VPVNGTVIRDLGPERVTPVRWGHGRFYHRRWSGLRLPSLAAADGGGGKLLNLPLGRRTPGLSPAPLLASLGWLPAWPSLSASI
jgi:hypothetical protein